MNTAPSGLALKCLAINAVNDLATGVVGTDQEQLIKVSWILLLVGFGRSLRNFYPMMRARVNGLLEMAVRREYFERILGKAVTDSVSGHVDGIRFRVRVLVDSDGPRNE